MSNAAVLDNETGLVWEKVPAQGSSPLPWSDAVLGCQQTSTGGRYGWRLPAAQELETLLDPSGIGVVAGNPFAGIAPLYFWSSTTTQDDPTSARAPGFGGLYSGSLLKMDAVDATMWCVRGGSGNDAHAPGDAFGPWSQALNAGGPDSCQSQRFSCVLSSQAVLDHETGLVWTKSAADAPDDLASNGPSDCYHAVIGGVSAWRLPTELELLTLLDTSIVNPAFSVPSGNPFTALAVFALPWLSSTNDGGVQWGVAFKGGSVGQPGAPFSTSSRIQLWNIWCVRAPDK